MDFLKNNWLQLAILLIAVLIFFNTCEKKTVQYAIPKDTTLNQLLKEIQQIKNQVPENKFNEKIYNQKFIYEIEKVYNISDSLVHSFTMSNTRQLRTADTIK